jgi:cytochrome bd-I ubiquinol oxidase subunit X
MWYFAWVLGIGFAVLLAIMNAMWGENQAARLAPADDEKEAHDGRTRRRA